MSIRRDFTYAVQPPLLYILTAVTLICPAYVHLRAQLSFAASRPNSPISPFSFWPLLFLLIPIPLLLISAIVNKHQPKRSAKIAFVATIMGWIYYLLMLCPLLLLMSLFFVISPLSIIVFFLPMAFLVKSTRSSRRILTLTT